MVKALIKYICQQCSYESSQWLGRCPNCQEWKTMVETVVSPKTQDLKPKTPGEILKPLRLGAIKREKLKRLITKIEEFDRVLGGGVVPGSVILLAGEPGIGKSTLMLQIASSVGGAEGNKASSIYVSGEESIGQIKLRADRLKIKANNLFLFSETNVETIIEQLSNYQLIIVDSVQSLWSQDLTGIPGSVGQVRLCAQKLSKIAKLSKTPLFLIGHVTKEGTIAGPAVLEHLVDTVLFLEGERIRSLRILRSFKNRFGPTDEVGVFEMGGKGMEEIKNPSKIFLEERLKNIPGSAIVVALEGTRPLLVEIQALVVPTKLPIPKKVGSGVSFQRLQIISALLEKHLNLPLSSFDIYINVSGGFKIQEPAVDLGIALAVISSFKNRPLPENSVCLGELGLLGEIREASAFEKRVKEAKRLGFDHIISRRREKELTRLVQKIWPKNF